jgi:hypothetical protein
MKNLEKYYNPVHGLELEPDVNTGNRQNENGILFLVEYLLMTNPISPSDEDKFKQVVKNIEVEPGLYDRGQLDNDIAAISGVEKRTISHDNISAISAGSYYLGTHHASDIAIYGLRHCFSYNNHKKGFRAPMNPGNWSIWLALGKTAPLLQLLFFPFYLVNFLITTNKAKEHTSGKLLYFVELFPLRNHRLWSILYRMLIHRLKLMYGSNPLKELTKIYFKDEQHPVRLVAEEFKYDDVRS